MVKTASLCAHSLYFDFLQPLQPSFTHRLVDKTFKKYVMWQKQIYSHLFHHLERDDLRKTFESLLQISRPDVTLNAFIHDVNWKEQEGEIRHLPKNRGLMGPAEIAFSEIIRTSLLDKCMFSLVNPDVRNYVLD